MKNIMDEVENFDWGEAQKIDEDNQIQEYIEAVEESRRSIGGVRGDNVAKILYGFARLPDQKLNGLRRLKDRRG